MNRSLSNLIRAFALGPVAAAVVLSAGFLVPAHALAAVQTARDAAASPQDKPRKRHQKHTWQESLPAPAPAPVTAGDPALTTLSRDALNAITSTTQELGLTERQPDCLVGATEYADPSRCVKIGYRRAPKPQRPAADPLSGLTGGVQPGLPVLGSLGRPQVSPPATPTRSSAGATDAGTPQTGTVLPSIMPSGLSGLLGGLPGATGAVPPSYVPGGMQLPLSPGAQR